MGRLSRIDHNFGVAHQDEKAIAAAKLCSEKFGDFMLEVAVLVFVFVPLDFWRGHVSSVQIATVGFVSGRTFFVGLACHWILVIIRSREKGVSE